MPIVPLIKIVRDRSVAYNAATKNISDPATAVNAIREVIGDSDRENFVVLCLNRKYDIISAEIASIGTISECFVHPREIFKAAVLSSAAAIIVGHNHPSGNPAPSQDDIEITKRLIEAGKIMGIDVLDHIVIGDDCHVSIRETTPIFFK